MVWFWTMKTTLIGLIAALFLAATSIAGGPPENDFKALFPKHWQISKEFTLAVAEAMPAESYDFKPNPQEMSFGELMIHIAQSNSEAFARVAGMKELAVPAGRDKQTEAIREQPPVLPYNWPMTRLGCFHQREAQQRVAQFSGDGVKQPRLARNGALFGVHGVVGLKST
jgi:hypothetical protein